MVTFPSRKRRAEKKGGSSTLYPLLSLNRKEKAVKLKVSVAEGKEKSEENGSLLAEYPQPENRARFGNSPTEMSSGDEDSRSYPRTVHSLHQKYSQGRKVSASGIRSYAMTRGKKKERTYAI